MYLSDGCWLLFMHLMRQQVRKAMDMRRMMAQLTMEAITATLKPKVSYGGTAARETSAPPAQAHRGPQQAPLRGGGGEAGAGGRGWQGTLSPKEAVFG